MPAYTIIVKTPIGDRKFGMHRAGPPESAKAEFERQQGIPGADGSPLFPAGEVTVTTDDPGPRPVGLTAILG